LYICALGNKAIYQPREARRQNHEYLNLYNHHIVQKHLGHISPEVKLKEWQKPILSYLLKQFTINLDPTFETKGVAGLIR
jgi:hypothetical protein